VPLLKMNRDFGKLDTEAKLRGGYYTPTQVAEWLCAWCIRGKDDRVLEPSCGDGVFLASAATRLQRLGASRRQIPQRLTGIEIQYAEAAKAALGLARLAGNGAARCVEHGDFFEWHSNNLLQEYDCVVGNPPFIRYQNFPEPGRSRGMQLMADLGLKPNKLTNIWVPFVVGAVEILAEHGRLAMVLPAELLQVSYAAQLRRHLVDTFRAITVVACNELFFKEAEQEVVLLLASGRRASSRGKCSVAMLQFDGVKDVLGLPPDKTLARRATKHVRHDTEKWLKYFLSPTQIGLLRRLRESPQVAQLSDYASVDVGVVTGNNAFFVLSGEQADSWGVSDYTVPLFGRSAHLRGALARRSDWTRLAGEGQRVYLLALNGDEDSPLPPACKRYIAYGEHEGVSRGYKCSIRKRWYSVPSVWVPDCFFFRQIHDFPKVAVNDARATSTDTIHRLSCKGAPRRLVTNLYTHLIAASAEVEGRSYGGGVLELEPTEAERLLVPGSLVEGVPIKEVDRLLREGRLEQVLEENDRLVLRRGIGLTKRECSMLKGIWLKMMSRRRSRKRNGA